MAASLLGTTGNWGIPEDETGVLILDISFDYSQQEKSVLDKSGEIIGLTQYQRLIEIKWSGLVKKIGGFSGKLGTALTLANEIPDHLGSNGGTTIISGISRTRANEDFEKIDVTSKHYPLLLIAA